MYSNAGRGLGCVVRPVRPVGVFGSRYLDADFTAAKSREVVRMVSGLGVGFSHCVQASDIEFDGWMSGGAASASGR